MKNIHKASEICFAMSRIMGKNAIHRQMICIFKENFSLIIKPFMFYFTFGGIYCRDFFPRQERNYFDFVSCSNKKKEKS